MSTGKKRFPWIATVVTFIAVVILARLGFWQLERMHEKQQRLTQLEQRTDRSTLNLHSAFVQGDAVADVPVSFAATIDTARLLYLDNRVVDGMVGYEVFAIADTAIGQVLLNFGWIKGGATRAELPAVELPTSLTEFNGNIVEPNLNPIIRETAQAYADFPLVVQQIDMALLSGMLNTELHPFYIALDNQTPQFVRNWQPVVMSPEKHLGYALQWFGLAIAAVVIFFIALFKRNASSD
ncbi:SURF1 family protein [Alteromonas facilis]|uniref:SURF1 family protein n=1 Tax=Alteromonas facilis TaxID=2048004 RepID=UPI000C28C3F6|nr:SURF1 family protein [Alteromonas facilis]